MGFNVLREPWVDCTAINGAIKTLGLRDLMLRAHELTAVRDASPMYEYGIYRLLTVIAMDMLRPRTADDIEDLLAAGCFDEKQVDGYFAECEKGGPRFELFDRAHPFLQDAFDPRYDDARSVKPVATMLPDRPSGHNHIHFEHRLAADQTASFAECAKALCAVSVFCTAGLQGPSSINGAPPLYVLAKGETLYETVIANCICADTSIAKGYSDPPPAYRSDKAFVPGEKMAATSLMEGMTLKARRITLIENDPVSSMYFQKGVDYIGYGAWRDPHTVISAKGSSMKPSTDRELWRNTAYIFGGDATAPLALRQYVSICAASSMDVVVYGLCTNQASLVSWSREEMDMPLDIVKTPWRMRLVPQAIELAEQAAGQLQKALRSIHIGSRSTWEEIVRKSVGEYYACIRNDLFTGLVPELSRCEPDDSEKLSREWRATIRRRVLRSFDRGADTFGGSAAILVQAAKAGDKLGKWINKSLMKEDA